jgi:hypothetical protein
MSNPSKGMQHDDKIASDDMKKVLARRPKMLARPSAEKIDVAEFAKTLLEEQPVLMAELAK